MRTRIQPYKYTDRQIGKYKNTKRNAFTHTQIQKQLHKHRNKQINQSTDSHIYT